LKTRQDRDFTIEYPKKRERNKTFAIGILPTKRVTRTPKIHKTENIQIFLLCSAPEVMPKVSERNG
jgi:hypothetical protein